MDVKEEEVDRIEISDDEVCRWSKTIRGPDSKGRDTYAPHCEFGNRVELDHKQVAFLKAFCAEKKPKKPFYICTLQKSHTIKVKGKMYFTKSYTKTHLNKHLSHLQHKEATLKVYHHKSDVSDVKMKLGKGKLDKRAMMTTKWLSVVDKWGEKYKTGDIMLFWFRRSNPSEKYPADLKMVVKKLKPCNGLC